ncbi:hypothetical protein [Methylorubrum sp. SB2]|uniref:hypothetical protein n=1 Tax=Methylorubrum subtropicum TaxID=3138812 RepID=UPI00313C917E
MPNEGVRLHEFTLPEKQQAFVTLMTVWAPHMSASEVVFIGWLLANTVSRGKRSGAYSLPQLINGVPNHRDGGMWTAGTGLSEPTVRRTIASCTAKGLIHTCRDPRGTRFTVVLTWNPATGQAEESNVVTLNLPRSRRNASAQPAADMQADVPEEWDAPGGDQNDQEGVINLITGACQNDHSSIGKPTNQDTIQGEDCDAVASRPVVLPEVRIRKRPTAPGTSLNLPRSGFGKVDASPRCAAPPPAEPARFEPRTNLADAIKAAGEARKARLAEARKRIDVRAYATTWLGAWGDTYLGTPCPGWSEKVGGMLKKSLKAYWLKGHEHRVHDFLEWSVRNWDVILAAKLSWMRQSPPPALPCIEFVARFLRNFQEAWGEQEELKFRGTEPGQKQAAFALAKREGITIDVALARVIARDASEKTMREVNEVAARANRDKRIAKLAADRVAGATRFTRENPHPRAHENVYERIPVPTVTPEMSVLQPIAFDPELLK